MVCSIAPIMVSSPTTKTKAVARPEMTLVPMKARLSLSKRLSRFWPVAFFKQTFSTASLSPVKPDCWTKKSRESNKTTSAGIMSPALNLIRSPTTISSMGISSSLPSRMTVAVLTIMRERLLAALSLRNSWIKRIPPERRTRTTMMREVVGSSSPGLANQTLVTRETRAMSSKMIVKGLIMDSTIRFHIESSCPFVRTFSP